MWGKDRRRLERKGDDEGEFEWKERIKFKRKDNERIAVYIGVVVVYYCGFIMMDKNE